MRKYILTLLVWAIKKFAIVDPRVAKVKEFITLAEAFGPEVSGQRKRSWVLNQLITAFPDSKIKDLSFLIEQVIQEI